MRREVSQLDPCLLGRPSGRPFVDQQTLALSRSRAPIGDIAEVHRDPGWHHMRTDLVPAAMRREERLELDRLPGGHRQPVVLLEL